MPKLFMLFGKFVMHNGKNKAHKCLYKYLNYRLTINIGIYSDISV
jgi:hypothetical protein